jgi:hypothetical protein
MERERLNLVRNRNVETLIGIESKQIVLRGGLGDDTERGLMVVVGGAKWRKMTTKHESVGGAGEKGRRRAGEGHGEGHGEGQM